MPRRGNNEGSIYKRKDGRWVAAITIGYESGRRKRKAFFGKTRREVAQKLNAALRAQAEGLPVNTERQPLAQYLPQWLEDSVKPRVRPSTYASYESLVRVHLVPELGRHRLARLGPQHIQRMMNRKLESGLAPRTVRYLHTLLHSVLGQAVKWGLVARNVAALVDPPPKDTEEVRPLDPEQALAFLASVREDRLAGLWTVALTLGLRRGEALGLLWDDVDLDRRTLRVRKALQRVDGTLRRVEPKSGRSKRTLPLPDDVVDALRRQRTRQLEERLAAGAQWQEHGLVFTTAIGTPLDGRNVTRRLQRLLQDAGLPHQTFHDMRHGCASLLLAQGVHPRVVMETLGHSGSAITMEVYSHVTAGLQREAADRMDAFLTGKDRLGQKGSN